MEEIGRTVFFLGLLVAAIGLAVWGLGKVGFRGLPGDIQIERENVRIYFPIVTSVVLSILLTGALALWNWWKGR